MAEQGKRLRLEKDKDNENILIKLLKNYRFVFMKFI